MISGCGEREIVVDRRVRSRPAMPTAGMTRLCAGTERIVEYSLDGARAPPAFGAAAKATIDLLGMPNDIVSSADGVSDVVVADDVAGTDDHERGRAFGDT
jgi:hypothetical protein